MPVVRYAPTDYPTMVRHTSPLAGHSSIVTSKTRERLISLAEKYETADFSMNDPSRVLRRYAPYGAADVECAAFVMAVLSFGRREQFLPKAEGLLQLAGESPARWIASGKWRADFPADEKKFYRFYSYNDIRDVLCALQNIITKYGTLGEAVRHRMQSPSSGETCSDTAEAISTLFKGCRAVSHGASSANKRTWMFLRWMVRKNSPVDLGLWAWHSPADLIIPLDTHVLQSAKRLFLIGSNANATGKTARELTSALCEVWPDDPCKGDFALFGWGIEGE